MISRTLARKAKDCFAKYPVVVITGPRQSGKTTLVKDVFSHLPYASLEDPDIREFALGDPRGFLASFPKGAVLDEAQRVPPLFSYLQGVVDAAGKNGMFVISGSQNFTLMESITQSLAGRAALLYLLPLSWMELSASGRASRKLEDALFMGFYPRIYDKRLSPSGWYSNYVEGYLERDVRMITKVTDLDRFQRFVRMCAARSGQILNLSSLGDDCGITHNTAKAWLSVLQASFLAHLLQPHHRNFNKRLIKSPKFYFYDTGLLCFLLGIQNPRDLVNHSMRGAIFETFIFGELLKGRFNRGLRPNLYFWRDHVGHEVDCVAEKGEHLVPIEMKSGQTVAADFLKGISYWQDLAGQSSRESYVVYGGLADQKRSETNVLGWKSFLMTVPGKL